MLPVSPELQLCRACDGLITEPEDAVFLWHEPGNSGPGWDVYAHGDCVDDVEQDDSPIRILARVLVAKLSAPDAPWRRLRPEA